MKYEAFISYRHGDIDEMVAVQVQKEIERYRVPKKIAARIGKKRVGKAFRDNDELHAASDLSAIIKEALDESEWLIVICSPRYLESKWCHQEIEYFTQLRGRDKVLVILVDGEPQDTFPKELTEMTVDGQTVEIEPLAVDIRGGSRKEILKKLKQERLRFLSSMLRADYDDLRNRQRERRIRRFAMASASVFVILAGVIGVITMKNIQLNRAYRDLDQSNSELVKADRETLRGESYYLAEYADKAYLEGDRETAIKLALAALPKDLDNPDRPYVPAAIRALTDVAGVYDYSAGYHVGFSRTRTEPSMSAVSRISEDGSTVLVETRMESSEVSESVSLNREIEVYRVSDGELLCTYPVAKTNYNDINVQSIAAALSKDGKKLYYLSDKALNCVDTADGKEFFTAEAADDMRVNLSAKPGHTAIVTFDHKKNRLYGYDLSGKKTLSLDIKYEKVFDMGDIDPASGRLPVVTVIDSSFGILIININSGETNFIRTDMQPGNPVAFSGQDHLVYRKENKTNGTMNLTQYNMKSGVQRCLSGGKHDIRSIDMSINKDGMVYYCIDNTVYEIDGRAKEKKKLWENKFSSEVVSVCAGDGLVAVSCKDGSMYVFDEASKYRIQTPSGDGSPIYMRSVSENAYVAMNNTGYSIRLYKKQKDEQNPGVKKGTISDITGGNIPWSWYTTNTQSNRFFLGLYNEDDQWLAEFDSDTMKKLGTIRFPDSSESLSTNQNTDEYVSITDYADNTIHHYSVPSMKEVFSLDDIENNAVIYREDEEAVYTTTNHTMRTIEAKTGKVLSETTVPKDFTSAAWVGEWLVLGTGKKIQISDRNGKADTTIEDAASMRINDEKGLIFYLNEAQDTWHAYDVAKKQVVWEEKAGSYQELLFFGSNRYVLKDFETVVDMDTWKDVLTLNLENGEPYGANTTDTCPYFVIWCKTQDTATLGNDIAVLYEKNGDGNPVGVIKNFVAMTPDNRIIAYDGELSLYSFPLLSVKEIMGRAEQMVGNSGFTEEQKEKYHLFRQ